MNRIDRLLGVLTVLQSKKYLTAQEIAERFGMSIRTVYRDLKALTEIGVPIGLEPHKGYFIVPGYFLPPISLKTEEANALVLMVALAEKYADASIGSHCAAALDKIKAALDVHNKESADYTQSHIKVYQAPEEKSERRYLTLLQNAIVVKTVIEIDYRDVQGKATSRSVEPIGLTYYADGWHVIGWCRMRKAYRDFRVSRIEHATATSQSFEHKNHIDLNQYIAMIE